MIPSPSTTSTALSTSTILTDDSFKEEASTFRLLVSFAEGKLIINLYDLLSWALYSKQYDEGSTQTPEIHKKVDLEDIYYSLTEANTTAEGRRQDQVYEYKHGQIVRKNGVPYYSVSQNGKITVYVTMTDERKGKKVQYISNLELAKVRDMTEIEVLNQKANKQKRDLNKEITDLKKEKETLTTKLTAKQAENVQIKTQFQNSTQELITLKQQKSKIESMFANLVFTKGFDGYQHSIYYKIIPFNQVFNFKVKIIKVTNPSVYIGIGVMDAQKCKTNADTLYSQSYIVGYYCWTANLGTKYSSGANQGTGFAQGQTVDVSVNLAARTVTWSVAGAVRATQTNDILADQNRTFVPFVQARYNGTSVQWVP